MCLWTNRNDKERVNITTDISVLNNFRKFNNFLYCEINNERETYKNKSVFEASYNNGYLSESICLENPLCHSFAIMKSVSPIGAYTKQYIN